MERKPEAKDIELLTKEMKVIIFVIGIITDLVLLCLFFLLLQTNYNIQYIRTIIFAALSIDSLFYVFSCKSLRKNVWATSIFSNRFLIFSCALGVFALLAALYVPTLNNLLKTMPLGIFDWVVVIALGFVEIGLIEATKYYFIKKTKTKISNF